MLTFLFILCVFVQISFYRSIEINNNTNSVAFEIVPNSFLIFDAYARIIYVLSNGKIVFMLAALIFCFGFRSIDKNHIFLKRERSWKSKNPMAFLWITIDFNLSYRGKRAKLTKELCCICKSCKILSGWA